MMVRTQRMPERWLGHWSGLRQKFRKPHSGRCDDGSWRFTRPAFGPGIRTGGSGGRKGRLAVWERAKLGAICRTRVALSHSAGAANKKVFL